MDVSSGIPTRPGNFQIFNNNKMKKIKLGRLNLLSEEVLQRSQLAAIYGGSGSGGSQCCIHLRSTEGSNSYLGSTCEMQDGTPITFRQAREWYFMGTSGSGMYVSGYCCTSCD